MMRFSGMLRTGALAGLFAAAALTPAMAERVYTRCDEGRCVKVVCDSYGYECRRYPVGYRSDLGRSGYYHNSRYDRDDWYRHHHFDRRHGRWVCDGDRDYCRWTDRRW